MYQAFQGFSGGHINPFISIGCKKGSGCPIWAIKGCHGLSVRFATIHRLSGCQGAIRGYKGLSVCKGLI
jgi:hypothetical protein